MLKSKFYDSKEEKQIFKFSKIYDELKDDQDIPKELQMNLGFYCGFIRGYEKLTEAENFQYDKTTAETRKELFYKGKNLFEELQKIPGMKNKLESILAEMKE